MEKAVLENGPRLLSEAWSPRESRFPPRTAESWPAVGRLISATRVQDRQSEGRSAAPKWRGSSGKNRCCKGRRSGVQQHESDCRKTVRPDETGCTEYRSREKWALRARTNRMTRSS